MNSQPNALPGIKLSSPATKELWEIPVLFEDAHLLALDKPVRPAHLARPLGTRPSESDATAARGHRRRQTLDARTQRHLSGQRAPAECGNQRPLAAGPEQGGAGRPGDQFGSDQPARSYVALVQGTPLEDEFSVEEKIGPHPFLPGRMRIDSRQGKKSRTDFAVLEKFSRWSLIRCTPRGERPQQVALHLSHAGFPVVGDKVHGGKPLWLSRLKPDFHLKPGREERPLIARDQLNYVPQLRPVFQNVARTTNSMLRVHQLDTYIFLNWKEK